MLKREAPLKRREFVTLLGVAVAWPLALVSRFRLRPRRSSLSFE